MRTQVAERRQSHSCTAVLLTIRSDQSAQVIVYKSALSGGTICSNAAQSGIGQGSMFMVTKVEMVD